MDQSKMELFIKRANFIGKLLKDRPSSSRPNYDWIEFPAKSYFLYIAHPDLNRNDYNLIYIYHTSIIKNYSEILYNNLIILDNKQLGSDLSVINFYFPEDLVDTNNKI